MKGRNGTVEIPCSGGPASMSVGPHARLVGALGREVLVEEVGGDRDGVQAVGGALEAARLPRAQPGLAPQPGRPTAASGEAGVLPVARPARAAGGPLRERKGRADRGQPHQVLALAPRGRAARPGEGAARAHPETLARRGTGTSSVPASMSWNLIDLPPGRTKRGPASGSPGLGAAPRSHAAAASARPPCPPDGQETAAPSADRGGGRSRSAAWTAPS